MFSFFFRGSRTAVLLRAVLFIATIGFIDWYSTNELPLGFLYLLPMLLVGRVLRPWQIAGLQLYARTLLKHSMPLCGRSQRACRAMFSTSQRFSALDCLFARPTGTGRSLCSICTKSNGNEIHDRTQKNNYEY